MKTCSVDLGGCGRQLATGTKGDLCGMCTGAHPAPVFHTGDEVATEAPAATSRAKPKSKKKK